MCGEKLETQPIEKIYNSGTTDSKGEAIVGGYYKQWGMKKKNGQGHKPVVPLRFSKSGDPDIERWYGTHFVDSKRIEQLKADE